MATANNVFAEKYDRDLRAHNKRIADHNRPSHAGIELVKRVLGSADSRFVSFERTANRRRESYTVYLMGTGFILRDGVRLVLRSEVGEGYDLLSEDWTLEVQFTKFGLRRRVAINDTVELAEYCDEVPYTDPFA